MLLICSWNRGGTVWFQTGSCCLVQAGLELTIFPSLALAPECWLPSTDPGFLVLICQYLTDSMAPIFVRIFSMPMASTQFCGYIMLIII